MLLEAGRWLTVPSMADLVLMWMLLFKAAGSISVANYVLLKIFSSYETFPFKIRLTNIMTTTNKIFLGLGIASGAALLATLLITGDRGQKTRSFLVKRARELKNSLNTYEKGKLTGESEIHYI